MGWVATAICNDLVIGSANGDAGAASYDCVGKFYAAPGGVGVLWTAVLLVSFDYESVPVTIAYKS